MRRRSSEYTTPIQQATPASPNRTTTAAKPYSSLHVVIRLSLSTWTENGCTWACHFPNTSFTSFSTSTHNSADLAPWTSQWSSWTPFSIEVFQIQILVDWSCLGATNSNASSPPQHQTAPFIFPAPFANHFNILEFGSLSLQEIEDAFWLLFGRCGDHVWISGIWDRVTCTSWEVPEDVFRSFPPESLLIQSWSSSNHYN